MGVINDTLVLIKAAIEAGISLTNGGTAVGSGNPLPVGGKSVQKSVSFTRPADVTAYAVNDVVANSTSSPTLMEFTGCANANAGQGYIVKARLMTDQKTCTARFRLAFYHTAPTAINDNAAKTMLFANKDKLIGRIDLDATATEDATNSTGASVQSTTLLPYVLASGSTSIYCILSTLDAFTPASGQQFYLEITCELS